MQQIMEDTEGNLWVADGRGGYAPYEPPAAPSGPQPFTIGTPRPKDPPSGYRWTQNGGLEPIAGGPASQNAPSGFRFSRDGNLEFIPGGPADPDMRPASKEGKALRQGDGDKLAGAVSTYEQLRGAAGRFQDDFAGNTMTGEAENWIQGLTGLGTAGQRDWWSAFRAADNVIRNQLFGASLTDGEKQAYQQTTVSPSMKPEIVRQNLERRVEIARKALERSFDRFRAAGFNEGEIQALAGEYASDLGLDLPINQSAKPFVLPKAAGVKEAAAAKVDGVTGRGGVVPIPELRGIENTVIDMIGKGATTGQVIDFLDEKLAPYNAHVETDLAGHLGDVVRKHKANPSQPVRSLGEGWEQLWHRRVPDSESSWLGRAADTDLGTAAAFAANAATFGLPATLAGKGDVMDAAAQERPIAALTGEVAGGISAMSGIGAGAKMLGGTVGGALTRSGGAGGDMLYGAIRGGVEDGPAGVVTGGIAGGLGNKVGSGLASGTGRAIRGVSDPAVRYLSNRGVPLTAGMTMGRNNALGNFMNHLESLPGIRGIMADRYREAEDGVFRAALNDSVEGIGGQVVDSGAEGLRQAYDASDSAYARALGGRQFQANEPQFLDEMQAAIAKGQAIPELGPQFEHAMRKDIKPLFDQQGMMTGERLQDALQFLRKRRTSYNGHPMGTDINDAFTDVEDAIRSMAGRQAPDVVPQLDAANKAYRHINVLADASANAVNRGGIPTPAQLNMASRNSAKKFQGKRAAVTGGRPFAELGNAAQEVIPSAVGDSGTSGRLAAIMLPTMLAGGAGGAEYAGAGPAVTAPLLALAALTSKTGSRAAQKVLTAERPEAIADLGEFLIRNRRKTGIFGAATGSAMVPTLSQ